jgi:Xaa-Pro aminopeptidase
VTESGAAASSTSQASGEAARLAAYGDLVFPEAEYRQRLARAAALLEEQRLDALLLTDDRHVLYFAGWGELNAGGPRARPRFLLVDRRGEASLLVASGSHGSASHMSWLGDVRAYQGLQSSWLEPLSTLLAERRLERGRLGLELGYEQRVDLSPVELEQLRARLPGAELVDAAPLLWRLRLVKSDGEVDRLRRACQVTSRAYERLFPEVRAGMSEVELARLFQRSAAAEGAATSGCFVLAGRGSYGRGNTIPTTYQARPGDMVWFDGGANVGGYRADFSRAGVLGGPTDHQRRLSDQMVEVVARVVAAIGPGVVVADLARLCEEELARRRLSTNTGSGRYGHGMGLLVTEPPHLATYDQTVLEPGMIITVEPSLVDAEGRYHVEDDVLVTAQGHEILTECPRELRTL